MGTTTLTVPPISKRAKHLEVQYLWAQLVCHLDNDLVDPTRKLSAERARYE